MTTFDPPIRINSRVRVWQHLISCTIPQDELPSLMETIFSGGKTTEMVNSLPESDTQTFIDTIDEVGSRPLIIMKLG